MTQIEERSSPQITLENLRGIIDGCDEVILDAIIARAAAVEQLGEVKLQAGLPVRDISRENEILRNLRERALERGGDPIVVSEVWHILLQNAKAVQERRRAVGRQAIIGNSRAV